MKNIVEKELDSKFRLEDNYNELSVIFQKY